jgi:cytochrome c oxidase subunit I+III
MTIGFGLLIIDVVVQLRYGRRARRDPWKATTFEWAMRMPPASYAFASIPHVGPQTDGVPKAELAASLARGEGYLGATRNGWQEALGVHITSGKPEQLIVLPNPTYLPLVTALVTGGVVLGFLFKAYWLSAALALVTLGLFVFAGRHAGLARDHGPLPVGLGVAVPPHTEAASAPSWLALICALVANGTWFTSLVFGTFYLWLAGADWQKMAPPAPNRWLALGAVACLVVAAVAARGSLRVVAASGKASGWMALTAVALLAAVAAVVELIMGVTPHPSAHALGATASVLLGYVALHAGVGLLFLFSNFQRIRNGYISQRRCTDLRLTRLWLDYTLATGVIALGLVLALPALVTVLGARP